MEKHMPEIPTMEKTILEDHAGESHDGEDHAGDPHDGEDHGGESTAGRRTTEQIMLESPTMEMTMRDVPSGGFFSEFARKLPVPPMLYGLSC